MQNDTGFQTRVENLAYQHSRDWRIGGAGFSSQDYWLTAQTHVRRMGVRKDLASADCFVHKVRDMASRIHTTRPHICNGPTADWDLAWLDRLYEGYHLSNPTHWSERGKKRCCAVVYFAYSKRETSDLGDFVYNLQLALQRLGVDRLSRALFCPLSLKAGELLQEVRYVDASSPRYFIVDAGSLVRSQGLAGVASILDTLNEMMVPWRCDSEFLSSVLRDVLSMRTSYVPLSWDWANFAGYGCSEIAYNLLADMSAL